MLDEMAGLRNDALPTCPECKADPAFLAKNSGIVTAIQGPNGSRAGPVRRDHARGRSSTARRRPGARFVEYMMADGYARWLGMAPEGKFPVRTGHPGRPEEVRHRVDDTARPASTPRSRWPRSTATRCWPALRRQPGHLRALGHPPGPGRAARRDRSAELPVPKALGDMVTGKSDADAAAAKRRHEGRRGDQGGRQVTTTAPGPGRARHQERPARDRSRRPLTLRRRESRAGLALVAPTLLVVIAGRSCIPIVWTVVLAFQRVRLARHLRKTGLFGEFTLDNFDRVLHPRLLASLWTTLIYSRRGTVGLDPAGPGRGAGRCAGRSAAAAGAGVHAAAVRRAGGRGDVRVEDDARPAARHRQLLGPRLLGWDQPIAFLGPGQSTALATVIAFETWRYFPFAFLFLHGPAPGGARRARGGRPGRRRHPDAAVPATSCCRNCCR